MGDSPVVEEISELPAKEPEATVRARALQGALDARFPELNDQQRVAALGLKPGMNRDLSLLRRHGELSVTRAAQLARGVSSGAATRTITDNALTEIERAVAALLPEPIDTRGPAQPQSARPRVRSL